MKNIRYILLPLLSFIIAFSINYKVSAAIQNTIHNGILIDGIDVSNMTEAEASSRVQSKVDAATGMQFKITSLTGYSIDINASDIDVEWANKNVIKEAADYGKKGNIVQRFKSAKNLEANNLELNIIYTFNENKLRQIIEDNMDGFSQEAKDYEFIMTEDGLSISNGQSGMVVDVDKSINDLKEYFANEWDGMSNELPLYTEIVEPQGSVDTLSKVKDVIGTFTTNYKSSDSNRAQNVENGCKLINGTTLYPGEEFSVLEALVPFTLDNGYREAASYQNGLVVNTLGGGICQVSSTLYNAVLLAELDVTARQNHSMVVTYVPPSADAAIAESTGKDLRFKNNRDYPIYIEGRTTSDRNITFNIYGIEDRPANRQISFKSEVIEETIPDTETIVQSAGKPMGYTSITSAHKGVKAKYYKTVTVDGVVQSTEEINSSTYRMVPRTLIVGVGGDNVDLYNQLQAAIATGSIDETRATANAIAAMLAQQQANVVAGDP